jgi:hypothetical protein
MKKTIVLFWTLFLFTVPASAEIKSVDISIFGMD